VHSNEYRYSIYLYLFICVIYDICVIYNIYVIYDIYDNISVAYFHSFCSFFIQSTLMSSNNDLYFFMCPVIWHAVQHDAFGNIEVDLTRHVKYKYIFGFAFVL